MLFFFVCGEAQTEKNIVNGTIDTIYSSVLGEHKTIFIHLPDNHGSVGVTRKPYPVV